MSIQLSKLPIDLLRRSNYVDPFYRSGAFEAFFDTYLQLWTVTQHDSERNQVGDAEYFNNREHYTEVVTHFKGESK